MSAPLTDWKVGHQPHRALYDACVGIRELCSHGSFGVAGVQPTLCLTSAALLQNIKLMRRPRRAVLYATAGAILAIGELIGLLVVREIHTPRPIPAELLQERVTYIYFLLTTAVVQACLGYLLGRQTDRLAELSETDALTGLPNRRTLRRRLTYEIRRASRYRVPLSLLLLDVDGLKRINDHLVRWAMRKYKRLRRRQQRARELMAEASRRSPRLFAHWRFGLTPAGRAMGAV